MSESHSTDERFVFLETKVSYQEHTIAQLNDAILHQRRVIDELTRRLTRIEGQLGSLGTGQDTPNERPPHY
jgi:SlyX protein